MRGRLVVAYHETLDDVVVRANGTRLRPLRGETWRQQNARYGERFCRYAEFRVPALPAEVKAVGLLRGRPAASSALWLPEAAVPEAA
eukprot:CAMPEP_0204544798 /NCGR_PEP_ID=MMETSP0661-20131031/20809_1 /ASSEMBLY_ACC=CAM_ASM_000606 /TAXON_ID=109239 /ORGANISM="Alexandrium margalefi, Strain AMGDE01CS-322" /LENGTH=86 /DNA_ID=CAMNT_0051551577 /DNA_START=27 /DNA_END=283 /DNA_ORIENTATION=+